VPELEIRPLPAGEYAGYRRRVIFACSKWDPQVGDVNTVARHAVVLNAAAAHRLARWAEALAHETQAMEMALLRRPDLHGDLALPRALRSALRRARGSWREHHVRVMRFDFHPTVGGWALSEVNSDVPGGFSEAAALPRLAAAFFPDVRPFGDVAEAVTGAVARRTERKGVVACVHATAYADDRQVMEFLADYLRAAGFTAVMAAPDHIRWRADGAECIAGKNEGPVCAIVRFFPAEWLPGLPRAAGWPGYFGDGVPACNHATAVLTQSKRLPLVWDRLGVPAPTWRELLPETTDPRRAPWPRDAGWILKPALGRVGEGVGIRGIIPRREWRAAARSARLFPRHWIAQRRFASRPLPCADGDRHLCVGVFTVDGRAEGFYGRLAERPRMDQHAQDIPVLVVEDQR